MRRSLVLAGRRGATGALLGFLALVATATPGFAQGAAPAPERWEFELTPYAWLAGLTGDVAVGRRSVSIDASFSDIVKNIDFGAALTVEARRGPWGFLLDTMYLKASKDGDTPGPGFDRVDLEVSMGLIEPALAYRVADTGAVAVDILVGGRLWLAENELRFSGGVLPKLKLTDDKVWGDPIVGGRLQWRLTDKWFASLLADVGGFGVASDVTWQTFAAVGYRFNETWSAKLGYRAIGVHYESGGFELDVIQHGFLLGVGIRF